MSKKIKDLELKVPKCSAFKYETHPDLPKLHQNMLFVGSRGSGKGVAMSNMIRMLPFDRILVISPTVQSNRELLKDLNIDIGDVFDPDDKTVVDKIIEIVNAERDDLERYRYEMKLYQKFLKLLKEQSSMIPDVMLETFFHDGDFKEPSHKYGGREPIIALIVDDCQSTPLFRDRKFQNLVIRHRHVGQFEQGGALGISIFTCIQNYTSQGGLPRAIRGNVTSMCVFSVKDQKQLDQIACECSGEVDKDTFMKVYKEAIRNNEHHEFLFVDFNKKPNHLSQFRRYFNEYLLV